MYMEIKKIETSILGRTWDRTDNSEQISQRKKAHQQYKSFILGKTEGVRVRFTVMILYFSLVKTFKIA